MTIDDLIEYLHQIRERAPEGGKTRVYLDTPDGFRGIVSAERFVTMGERYNGWVNYET